MRPPGRLDGLDAARGLAILGMMTAHIVLTSGEKLVDGRSSILFATIAGMSLGLLSGAAGSGGTTPPGPATRGAVLARVARRAALILAIGFLLTALDPPLAVILDDYGIWFFLLLPTLLLRGWMVAALAAVMVLIGPMLIDLLTPAIDDSANVIVEVIGEWFVTGTYPVLAFICLPLAGLAIARFNLRSISTRFVMVVGGALVSTLGYGAALVIPGVTAEAHSGSSAELLGSGGLAVAVVGAALLLLDSPNPVARVLRIVLWPLSAAGSMPLTIYTLHVIGMTIATRVALQESGDAFAYPPWLLPLMIVGALAVGSVFRATLGFGPLERAIGWLSTADPRSRR